MAKSKKSSLSSIDSGRRDVPALQPPAHKHGSLPRRIHFPKDSYRNHFDLVEPQIKMVPV